MSVLVVDDHTGFRHCARRFLEQEDYRVVGEAGDASSGLETARVVHAELALVDVHLPDFDGVELASKLRALDDPPEVILVTSYDPDDFDVLARAAGARGCLCKERLSRRTIEELL